MGRWSFVPNWKSLGNEGGKKTTVPAVRSFANNLLLAPTRDAVLQPATLQGGTASLTTVDRIVPIATGSLGRFGMNDGTWIGQEFERENGEGTVELNGHFRRPRFD